MGIVGLNLIRLRACCYPIRSHIAIEQFDHASCRELGHENGVE
jgi:hypothetical protein